MYPEKLKELIDALAKLPGIGIKTAERLALFIATQQEESQIDQLADVLKQIKKSLKPCGVCGLLTDQDKCSVCNDLSRDRKTIMVVSESKDAFALENMGTFRGLYHVINGLIDFSKGIEPNQLNIDSLIERAQSINEIIVATNSTVEGELTAQYIKSILKDNNIIISRLGYGLPVGADLKYADQLTLIKAVENRRKY